MSSVISKVSVSAALICMLLVAIAGNAQQYLARNYTAQDGLSHPNVYRIYQDRQGFLWFCTDYGVTRYDGQNFTSAFADREGLLNNSILSFFEDSSGLKYASSYKAGIMVLTDTGVRRYTINNGRYPPSAIQAANDVTGNIWVLGKPEVFRVRDGNVNEVKVYEGPTQVWFINAARVKGKLLFCTSRGIYAPDGDNIAAFLPDVLKDTVTDIADDGNNGYWVGCRRRVVHISGGHITEEYKLAGQLVKKLLFDSHKNLWIALDGEGILQLNSGKLTDITTRLTLGKTVVNDMLEDREGNIWLATYGAGLFKISSLGMLSYKPPGDNASIFCRSLCVLKGDKILIASIGKLSVWSNGHITPYAVQKLRPDQYVYFVNRIGDNLYIGTSQGLLLKNTRTGVEQYLPVGYSETYAGLTMNEDSRGVIKVGNYSTLLVLQNGVLQKDTLSGVGAERYNTICEDKEGNMWYGTDHGVLLEQNGKILRPFAALGTMQVAQVLADKYGRVWIATMNGLLMYENGRTHVYKKADGLASNKCNSLLEDSTGRMWVGTLAGLNYIDPGGIAIKRCNAGLYNDDVLSLCCAGNLLFAGSVNRLISVDLTDIDTATLQMPVYITSVKTASTEYAAPAKLELAYNDNKLTVNFIAVSYQAPGDIEYRYKIEGLYDRWTTTKSNHLELSALPSGSYTFVLNARRGNGPWSSDVILAVHIATPFWKTWWFFSLVALTVVIVVAAIIRTVEKRRRRQLVLRNKMAYLKQQALSALINPHFMFNCLNSIQYYLDANENDKANAYLADFAHLIRLTLDDAQKVYISLDKEINRIEYYLQLEQLRFGEELKYRLHIDETLDRKRTFIPNMILQPYVENAIWHGIMPKKGKGEIVVSFMRAGDRELRITVQDDGVGLNYKRNDEKIREGHYGMSLTEERLKLLNRLSEENFGVTATELYDDQGAVAGTKIEITVTISDTDVTVEEEE